MSSDPKYSKEECGICCGSKSSFIECAYCNVKICLGCNEKYLLTVSTPRCMNCNKEWSYNWLRSMFPKNWINKSYRMYKENQLIEFEKSLLPEIMDEVAFESKFLDELELINNLRTKLNSLHYKLVQERFSDEKKINSIFKEEDYLQIFNFCYLYKGDDSSKSYLSAWEEWEKTNDKEFKKYLDLRNVTSVRESLRYLTRRQNKIEKILETKIDLSLLKDIFGDDGYKVFKPIYNPENNTINSTLNFHFSEKRDKKIRKYILTYFNINIPPNKNLEEGKEAFYILSIFPEKCEDKYKIKLQFNGHSFEMNHDKLNEFFKPTLNLKKISNFSRPCPKENCRGFFRNDYICGLCNVKICKHCLEEDKEIKEEDEIIPHKCNPDTIKSVRLMEKDSKPCPKCQVIIFKTSGCNQIWCTQCKTAFDWNTLIIETGRIHNPHYWEYLRKMGKEEDEMKRIFNGGNNEEKEEEQECFTFENLERYIGGSRFGYIFQKMYHLQGVDLLKYRVENLEERNKDLRKLYLRNKINEKEFRSKITARFKRNNFNLEMTQILEMFIQTVKDLFVSHFIQNNIKHIRLSVLKYFPIENLYNSLVCLQNYLIQEVEKICKIYDYVVPLKTMLCLSPTYFDFLKWEKESFLSKKDQIKKDILYYQNSITCLNSGNDYFSDYEFQPRMRLMNRRYWRNQLNFENYKVDKMFECNLEITALKQVENSL